MSEILIRKMMASDIPHVLKIEQVSFSTPWSETAFFNEVYRPYSLSKIAALEGNIIGYICANYVIDEGHILNLAVHPDFRRSRVGTQLIEDLLEEMKKADCRYIYLEVRLSNIDARKFYECFGFKVIGTRKNYYVSPNEDAIIMMHRL
jgi:[ribosomal protein S18]-alanine N-acetyltransferase